MAGPKVPLPTPNFRYFLFESPIMMVEFRCLQSTDRNVRLYRSSASLPNLPWSIRWVKKSCECLDIVYSDPFRHCSSVSVPPPNRSLKVVVQDDPTEPQTIMLSGAMSGSSSECSGRNGLSSEPVWYRVMSNWLILGMPVHCRTRHSMSRLSPSACH